MGVLSSLRGLAIHTTHSSNTKYTLLLNTKTDDTGHSSKLLMYKKSLNIIGTQKDLCTKCIVFNVVVVLFS